MEELEGILQKRWDSTCKILFGRELGPLKRFRPWLSIHLPKVARKRTKEGPVVLARDLYSKNAKIVPYSSVAQTNKPLLSINEIKDIDSILAAISERCEYAGNKVLGNSAFVNESDIVIDSQFVNNSTNIEESSYIDSSFMVRKGSKYCFGSGYCGQSEFLVRTVGTFNSKYCFESYFVPDSSSTYFCQSCFGCRELMFCFGQRGARYKIGNLQLPKEKYLELKKKLLGEIAQILQKKGKFPTLIEIAKESPLHASGVEVQQVEEEKDFEVIEKGFHSTSKLIFKEPIGPLKEYENWLTSDGVKIETKTGAFGRKVSVPTNFTYIPQIPKERLVNWREMDEVGRLTLDEKEICSLDSLLEAIGKIAYFTPELYSGNNRNCIECSVVLHATNSYKTYDVTYADNVAFCFLALNSKFIYGGFRVVESEFSIRCYNSLYMTRCFEMDSCSKCSDCYFCHNCENCHNCIFCFNAKNLRYAIGNVEVGPEKFLKIKEMLLSEILSSLRQKKFCELDIYSLGKN